MENRLFYFSLSISLMVHLLFVSYLTFSRKNILQRPVQQIEVTYQMVISEREVKKSIPRKESSFVKEEIKSTPKIEILTKKEGTLPFFERKIKDISKLAGKFRLDKKKTPRIFAGGVHKKVSIPLFKSDKITNQEYTGYELRLQNKIKKIVQNYTDRDDFNPGHVYLTFLIASNGLLKEVRIDEERTQADDYLRNVAIRSIKAANPFPPFPTNMNYPELSYNILITFDINQ